jgi:hypothetical protein
VVTRQERINDFDHEGTPPADQPLQILCEDHAGTYAASSGVSRLLAAGWSKPTQASAQPLGSRTMKLWQLRLFLKRVLPAKIRTTFDAGGLFAHRQPPVSSHQIKSFLFAQYPSSPIT